MYSNIKLDFHVHKNQMSIFGKKQRKKEKEDKDVAILNFGPGLTPILKNKDVLTVVSIDPGEKHYGFRIERRYRSKTYPHLVEKVEGLVFCLVGYNRKIVDGKRTVLFEQINEFHERYKEYYPHVDILLVEHQVFINYKTVRIQQHAMTWFNAHYPHISIFDLRSQIKTQALGAPRHLNYDDRKEWDIAMAKQFLYYHACKASLQFLAEMVMQQKGDDVADTIVQIEGFFKAMGLPYTDLNISKEQLSEVSSSKIKEDYHSLIMPAALELFSSNKPKKVKESKLWAQDLINSTQSKYSSREPGKIFIPPRIDISLMKQPSSLPKIEIEISDKFYKLEPISDGEDLILDF